MAGMTLLLPLFKFQVPALLHSELFVKAMMWIPIFAGFVTALYMNSWLLLMLTAGICWLVYRELQHQVLQKPAEKSLAKWYFIGFAFCVLQLWASNLFFPSQQWVNFLLTVCFSSALSDVAAFFCGKYFGRHHLPQSFNSKKSWEGVAGQLAGALLGVIVLQLASLPAIFWLWLPIGIGTALGDLANSYVKRRMKIKDWGNSIPGHGGYLDRFSSLFAGLALACYALFILG